MLHIYIREALVREVFPQLFCQSENLFEIRKSAFVSIDQDRHVG